MTHLTKPLARPGQLQVPSQPSEVPEACATNSAPGTVSGLRRRATPPTVQLSADSAEVPAFQDEEIPTATGPHALNVRLARALHEIGERDRQIRQLEQQLEALQDANQSELESNARVRMCEQRSQVREELALCPSLPSDIDLRDDEPFAEQSPQTVLWHSITVGNGAEPPLPPSQRKDVRRTVELEVEFDLDTQFYTGLTQDISKGGVFIATYAIQPIGTVLTISFELPCGTKVTALGEVRWLRDASSASRPGMGVAFMALDDACLSAVARFCHKNQPLYVEV